MSEIELLARRYYKGLWDEFASVDSGRDRRIDFAEFRAGAPRMGLELTDGECRVIFGKMDADGSGQVLFHEFCAFMGRLKAEHRDRTETRERPARGRTRCVLSLRKGTRDCAHLNTA